MHSNRPILLLFVLGLMLVSSCSRRIAEEHDRLVQSIRDSLTTVITDSLSRRYGDSIDLVEELWRQRLLIETPPDLVRADYSQNHIVWRDRCLVRDAIGTEARVVETLPLGTFLTPQVPNCRYESGYESAEEWFAVRTPSGNEGYFQRGDACTRVFGGDNYGTRPWRLLSGPVAAPPGWAWFQLMLTGVEPADILDTLVLKRAIGEGGTYFHIRRVYNLAWRDCPTAFWVESSNGACPEYHDQRLIAVIDGKLREVANGFITGEGGWAGFAEIFLPIRFENGKVLLVNGGDQERIFDEGETRLDTLLPPPSLRVPIEQCAIIRRGSAEDILDENNRNTYDKQGRRKVKETVSREYYRWTGRELVRVGE